MMGLLTSQHEWTTEGATSVGVRCTPTPLQLRLEGARCQQLTRPLAATPVIRAAEHQRRSPAASARPNPP